MPFVVGVGWGTVGIAAAPTGAERGEMRVYLGPRGLGPRLLAVPALREGCRRVGMPWARGDGLWVWIRAALSALVWGGGCDPGLHPGLVSCRRVAAKTGEGWGLRG